MVIYSNIYTKGRRFSLKKKAGREQYALPALALIISVIHKINTPGRYVRGDHLNRQALPNGQLFARCPVILRDHAVELVVRIWEGVNGYKPLH